MLSTKRIKVLALGGSALLTFSVAAFASEFNVPSGDLKSALKTYAAQSGVQLVVSAEAIRGVRSNGVQGELSAEEALGQVLAGTGFSMQRRASGSVAIVPSEPSETQLVLAQAAPRQAVETVTVTSSKLGGADVQSIPISITALSQEQLTATQTAGGPDLIKQVPNMTFTKTNFTGYNIQIRGIGTQAISVTTDPAVAVALNDTPFIRNHFFEQEFFDLGQAEVLRGPQGTLYGRNATAGVVNLTTAKPTDQFEAMASAELGNYHQRRFEGMINIPLVDDRLDLRVAGEWTKRQGYSFNALDDERIDGRDLWSGRVTVGWKPIENLQTYLVWEHFSEADDRMRTSKQLCKTDPGPSQVGGYPVLSGLTNTEYEPSHFLSQGCSPSSLYSKDAFQVPNGLSLPYYDGVGGYAPLQSNDSVSFDPYASTVQSRNLRVIETTLNPEYKAKNDVVELNTDYGLTPSLTATSQTAFSQDFLWSTEDYNRFNTARGAFSYTDPNSDGQWGPNSLHLVTPDPLAGIDGVPANAGVFCDPQLGCSDRLVAQDLSEERSWQFSQEFRLASHFTEPLNFSVGGNYLHYETEENYYVFINTLTAASYNWTRGATAPPRPQKDIWIPGVSDNSNCLKGGFAVSNPYTPYNIDVPTEGGCIYIDPNPLTNLNNNGHNYFLSQNPYTLNSYAAFGEFYYDVTSDLKLTAGLRWTEDQKHFTDIPSQLLVHGYGYPISGVVNQQWDQFTGRAVANWTPRLDFTDQTMFFGSYAHGYKAGGANPPGAILLKFASTDVTSPIHPLTFKPEFIDAFELGSKNTLLDGSLTINTSLFYYNYENYQISEIVDRTAINLNFDAHVKGAELESTWEPLSGLRFNLSGGWEDTALAKGARSIDLMDRTAGDPNWMVVKPFATQSSNCILPTYVVEALVHWYYGDGSFASGYDGGTGLGTAGACTNAYSGGFDPLTGRRFTPNPTGTIGPDIPGYLNYPGFDPVSPTATNNGAGPAPNNGEGIAKNLGGNELPNAPPFTISGGAQYTLPLTPDWAGTLRADYYWQDYSWARVFNDNPYDRLRGYATVNLSLILTSQAGWQVMLYDKNVFNETAITGTFLNSDDSGLTTNVFLTDPKLIGVRVTKNW